MKWKWGLTLLVLCFLVYYWVTHRDAYIREKVKVMLVKAACESGELDNYYQIPNPHSTTVIYNRIKQTFPLYGVREKHLQRLSRGERKEVFGHVKYIAKAIDETCGSEMRSLTESRAFVALMLNKSKK